MENFTISLFEKIENKKNKIEFLKKNINSEIQKEIQLLVNKKNKMNGLDLLKQIKDETLKVIFFDPQYRGILDKMSYGNEGVKRGKERSELPQMTEEIIKKFVKNIERVLLPNGYLFLWVDKFHLVEGIKKWFDEVSALHTVDMITWDKKKIGMGYRSRRRSEYLVIIQKEPKKAKSTWVLHDIPDVWEEKIVKNHTHSKPIELQKKLILATTFEGDLVCDPASGGYSVFEACKEINRNFIGCDIVYGKEEEN
ncbi:DNA methyltransferase [Leptotrichia massiliensis]|uniref:DNA methyltransferase n=1 Tax=Leptotrichia massiliensis TaxID=1852388 RepID=UPI0028E4099F|nr:DNA methyltransferase [Leptotrichia massiliensis]